jgi:TetR/AcrR family transcriptional regulator, repressor of fatR-cypB operon
MQPMNAKSQPFFVAEGDPPAKRAILEAALDLFAEHGVDGVTVRDIASRTGFTNPALFRHFKGKDELAFALFEACYRRLAATMSHAERKGTGLKGVFATALRVIEEHPAAVHYVFENLRRYFRALPPEVRAASILGTFRRLVGSEAATGSLRRDTHPDLAVAVLVGTLGQVARMAHFGELPQRPTALADELWSVIHRGLGA